MNCLLPPPLALLPRLNLFGFRVHSNPWRGPGAISIFSKTTSTRSRRKVREASGRSERARDRAKFRPSASWRAPCYQRHVEIYLRWRNRLTIAFRARGHGETGPQKILVQYNIFTAARELLGQEATEKPAHKRSSLNVASHCVDKDSVRRRPLTSNSAQRESSHAEIFLRRRGRLTRAFRARGHGETGPQKIVVQPETAANQAVGSDAKEAFIKRIARPPWGHPGICNETGVPVSIEICSAAQITPPGRHDYLDSLGGTRKAGKD